MIGQQPPEVPRPAWRVRSAPISQASREETPGAGELRVSSSEEFFELLQFGFRLVGVFLSLLGVVIVQRRLRPR